GAGSTTARPESATNRTSIARRGGSHKRGPAGDEPRRYRSRRRLRTRLEQPRIAQKARAQRGQRHAAFLAVGMTAGTAGPGMTGTLDQNAADDESGGSAAVGARAGSSVASRRWQRRLAAGAPPADRPTAATFVASTRTRAAASPTIATITSSSPRPACARG